MWTDMYIETTLMKYCHGPGELVGITLNEHALCRWALSLHICSRLTKDIADLKEATLFEVDHHKEESTSRIKADSDDRNAIRDKLETCVWIPLMSPKARILSTLSPGRSATNMSMLKTLFSDWRSPAARIRIGLSHRILPNDQDEGHYQGKKQRGADPME